MVNKTTTKSAPESLDQRADRVAQEQAEISRERARLDQERHDRLTAHQRAVDQATVDQWRPRDLDAAVVDARATLGKVIAEQPITQAVATYLLAQGRRSVLWSEQINALGQLGRPTEGAQMPPVTGEPVIQELIFREASNQAEDLLAVEANARYVNRNTIPIEETE